jgi:hypothetical protein
VHSLKEHVSGNVRVHPDSLQEGTVWPPEKRAAQPQSPYRLCCSILDLRQTIFAQKSGCPDAGQGQRMIGLALQCLMGWNGLAVKVMLSR